MEASPMEQINGLTEKLAAAATLMEPDDLTGLAEVHGCLKAIDQWIDAHPGNDAPRQQVKSAAGQAEALLEKLILQEVQDATAAVNELMQLVMTVQTSAQAVGESNTSETSETS